MRVNLVDPKLLTDQHLMAEYRESFMLPGSMPRWFANQSLEDMVNKVPKEFTLGKGHMLFFLDKGLYMSKRYTLLIAELKRRQFTLDPDRSSYPLDVHAPCLRSDYSPSEFAIREIKARIRSRILEKPSWYRYCGTPVTELPLKTYNRLLFKDAQ